MWGGKRFKCGGVEGMIILSKALIWFWESKEEDGIVVDALHAAKWEYKANLQYIVLTRHVTCNQNKHWYSCTRNVAVHMYVTHHIKQQVALPGPCNLKLNWACTLWSCSPHTELCLLLSMWMHLPVSTLLPWSRHMPSPIQSLWIPLHCTLAVAGSFRMKGLAQCAVAYRLQDLHLLDSRATALMRKNWQVWPPAREEGDDWLSVSDGGLHEGPCHIVNCCNLI